MTIEGVSFKFYIKLNMLRAFYRQDGKAGVGATGLRACLSLAAIEGRMKKCVRLGCLAMGMAICALVLAQPLLAYTAYRSDAPRQDETAGAAQDYDPGASVQATDANSDGTDSENVPGGGMVGPDYRLGPEDVLTITVLDLPEMTQTVRVDNDGTVTV
ncbi:MAG: polysaccharide biosynthesis/export family protein, partial [Terriglobia bacterium]